MLPRIHCRAVIRPTLALAALVAATASAAELPTPAGGASSGAAAGSSRIENASSRSAPTSAVYSWSPGATEALSVRFAPPPGFARVSLERGSFGEFLRTLPLLPPQSRVLDFRGRRVREGTDPAIAAVVDIDIGAGDRQQCADSVIRLDAEWRYGRGDRRIAYRSLSGPLLSYRRYLLGERARLDQGRLVLSIQARPRSDDHSAFRRYLDDAFTWVNTASLERDSVAVPPRDLRPGDFFVASGKPFGHAVLVLDQARDAAGRSALLLGQGYMPAQSFQVLRGPDGSAWFVVEADSTELATPLWKPFPMRALRRLP